MLKTSYWGFLIACSGVFTFGCGGGRMQQTISVSPQSAIVGSGQVTQFMANITGDSSGVIWSLAGTAGGSIDSNGNYTAPAVTQNATTTISAAIKDDPTKSASASVTIIAPGVVTPSANVQVAMYTIEVPDGAGVSVQFGPDTTYGRSTWQQPSPPGGGAVGILVAGMMLNSTYHMRAAIKSADGTEVDDVDHTFTTGNLAAATLPIFTATTTSGATPQSGVELLDLVSTGSKNIGAVVTDLSGNILWAYNPLLPAGVVANPIKMLPNGHFLIDFSSGAPDGANSVLREIDLTGHVIWEMTAAQLNQALAAATCAGCNITVTGTHHDFITMPNGHLIVIAGEQVVETTPFAGFPSPLTVTGDVIIDLDENHKPVWLWSAFDHLDLKRQPMFFPDWTHTNSVFYSPDDKSLIISMRHQHWILKIDYNDGQGTGDIIWKLGHQGDFTLVGGTDPQDWFYAQHDANVISPKSSGTLQLLMFDNGNSRLLDNGKTCGVTIPCISRVPILELDEAAKTATIEWVDDLTPAFAFFGGSARILQNGNVELDECGLTMSPNGSAIFEVTRTTPPQTVWQMQVTGQYAYRSTRIPSLYPGVQW